MRRFLLALLLVVPCLIFAISKPQSLLYAELVPAKDRAAFVDAVTLTAERLHVEPNWLMVVFRFETAGTFRPNVRNRYSGAVGLIQFIPSTAARLGTTPTKLAAMSLTQQLVYVEKYFAPFAGKMGDVYDVYMVVFAPAFLGRPNRTVLYSSRASTQLGRNRYQWNRVLDTNQDGLITIKDVKKQIKQFVPRYDNRRGIE